MSRGDYRFGEVADGLADMVETRESGGGNMVEEMELGKEGGFEGEDIFGRFTVIKFDEEGGEAFDEGGSGGEAEVAGGVDESAREPDWRETSVKLVGGNLFGGGDLWPALAVGDDGGEAFVMILDGRKAGSEGELFSGERHEKG